MRNVADWEMRLSNNKAVTNVTSVATRARRGGRERLERKMNIRREADTVRAVDAREVRGRDTPSRHPRTA